jgi:hypothetical protein
MCQGDTIAAGWVEAIRRLVAGTGARPVLLIQDPEVPQRSRLSEKLRKSALLHGNLWHLHNRWLPLREIPAFRPVPLASLGPDLPRRVCPVERRGRWSQYFRPEDVEALRALELDFILKFAYGILRGDALRCARYGVWSFHHDDEQRYRGGPPAFWELATGDPVQGVILQRLTDRLDGGVVLEKAWVATDGLSYRRNLQRIVDASLDLPARAARALQLGRRDSVDAAPVHTTARIRVAPTDPAMVRFAARLMGNWLRYKLENQAYDRWNVGVVRAPIQRFLDPAFQPSVEWAPYHREGLMIADPFGVASGDGIRVFCEEFSFFTERGWIAELSWHPQRGWGPLRTVLDERVHMSYPYPIRHQGQLYLVPECGSREQLTVYRAGTTAVEHDRTMLDGPRVLDSTIIEHAGRWWLFCTHCDSEPNAKLQLYSGTSPLGPWTPHPGNPVKTDVRSSRPAGTPFVHEGRLYRPAQDCSVRYGWRLAINEVTRLTPDEFSETPVRWIGPLEATPYPHGLHTLAGCGEVTLVDAKWSGLSPTLLKSRLIRKLGRLGGRAEA